MNVYQIARTSDHNERPKRGIVVDCGCKGNPGKAHYRGVNIETGETIFYFDIPGQSTNNIAEWLACVAGLRMAKKLSLRVFSDSTIAIKWCRIRKCLTNFVVTDKKQQMVIDLAIAFLNSNSDNHVFFWNSKLWGENPSDQSGTKGIKKITYQQFKAQLK